jgi:hypothetical protein
MKKKILTIVLLFGFVLSVFGQSVSDFEYIVENGGIIITRYKGSVKDVVIPERINGLPVVVIGYRWVGSRIYGAFEGNKIISITIPNSVTHINEKAFFENLLTSVTIPNSVTHIGRLAFAVNQLNSVKIGNSVTLIDRAAFSNNNLTSVTIPNSVTRIKEEAFNENQLTSVTIPNSVTFIEYHAFWKNRINSITIPNSTILDANVFDRDVEIIKK